MARRGKVSIVGMGTVGTAIAYACLIRGSARELALYDVNAKKVRAEVLDLNHGSPFVPPCRVTGGDDLAVTAESTIVIVTAGAKQHPGQSRLDLASTNVAMARKLIPQLFEQSPHAVVVMVTNPVDVVTCAAVNAVDVPRGRVFGSGTVLDSSRFRHLIAARAGIAVENVHGFIVGEHGDSEIPVWSAVTVGGGPAAEVFDQVAQEQISSEVVNAAYEIIAGKGRHQPGDRTFHGQDHRGHHGRPAPGAAGVDRAVRRLRHRRGRVVAADCGVGVRGRPGTAGAALG